MHPLLLRHDALARRSKDSSWLFYALGAVGGFGVLAWLTFFDNPVRNLVLTALRTPQSIFDAVTSVDPEHNPDLQPGANGGAVWCNKALYLMLRKLGVVLPWAQWGTRVNDLISYVAAGNDGWYQVPDLQTATQIVAMGQGVAIATYFNESGGSGHAALVLPDGFIAQAGSICRNHIQVASGFGSIQPVFYVHG